MSLFLRCEIPLVMANSVVSRWINLRKALLFHLPPIWIRIGSTFLRCRSVANEVRIECVPTSFSVKPSFSLPIAFTATLILFRTVDESIFFNFPWFQLCWLLFFLWFLCSPRFCWWWHPMILLGIGLKIRLPLSVWQVPFSPYSFDWGIQF